MPVLNENEQRGYVGRYRPSCVFNVFAYLSPFDNHNSKFFWSGTLDKLGFQPDNMGGVPIDYIAAIGALGSMHIQPLVGNINANGRTDCHQRVMATIRVVNNGVPMEHAVVIRGVSGGRLIYWCPTKQRGGEREVSDFVAFYSVLEPIFNLPSGNIPSGSFA